VQVAVISFEEPSAWNPEEADAPAPNAPSHEWLFTTTEPVDPVNCPPQLFTTFVPEDRARATVQREIGAPPATTVTDPTKPLLQVLAVR
jgi:hypothetical protein